VEEGGGIMSQEDVYNAIKKFARPVSTKEIGTKVKSNLSNVGEKCRKLHKQGELKKEIKLIKEGASHPRRVALWSINKLKGGKR
jgi:hypothetical protein